MEIITPRTDEKKQSTCPHCGAVISYFKTEIQEFVVMEPFPHRLFYYIECPSCHKEFTVPSPNPPSKASGQGKISGKELFRMLYEHLIG